MKHNVYLYLLPMLLLLVACGAPRPTMIQHVVLIKLNDSNQRAALIDDCNRLLPGINGVSSYWCGSPDQSGRVSPAIDTNWDVALCVGYPDADAYGAYVADPAHVVLVDTWKARFQWLRIHDVSLDQNVHSQPTIRE